MSGGGHHTTDERAAAVRGMFDGIARRYDFLNHFLSLGIDISWRKKGTAALGDLRGHHILDLACGTGDFALEIARAEPTVKVTGADFAGEMVRIGVEKVERAGLAGRVTLGHGDALALAFADDTFDGVTCAFGVRNFADLEKGLAEMIRVIRPGAPLVILEFTQPTNPFFAACYRFYFTKVLPILGGLVSGSRSAYEYLPDTVYRFPRPDELSAILRRLGLGEVTHRRLTFGIACLHVGRKAKTS